MNRANARAQAYDPAMTRTRLKTRNTALLATVVAVLGTTSMATVGVAQAAPPKPSVKSGDCLQLTTKQLDASSLTAGAKRVDCTGKHSLEVVAIGHIPHAIAKRGRMSAPVNSWRFYTFCMPALKGYAKDSPASTKRSANGAWQPNVYLPTAAQWKHGARWAICAGDQFRSAKAKSVHYDVTGPFNGSGRNEKLCGAAPNKIGWVAYASCTGSHRFTLYSWIPAWNHQVLKPFPGQAAVKRKAHALVNKVGGRWVTYPLAKSWKAGGRTVMIWK